MNIHLLKAPSLSVRSLSEKFFFIHALSAIVHAALLVGFVCYQFVQPLFLNSETWIFVYLFLFCAFVIDLVYFYFHDKVKKESVFQWLFLFTDTVLMTLCLSAVIPALYPVLVFIYMLSIFSAGLLGQYKGAFAQGLLVSILFSWILILSPAGMDYFSSPSFSFVLNNTGFMIVAGLSGFFGAIADKMEWSLVTADKAVSRLENLNELIVENINMGLFISDEEGGIAYSNQKALNILGLPNGFSGSLRSVFPELKINLFSRKPGEVEHFQSEYKDGSHKKAIEIFVSPVKDSRRYLILFQDCTPMREMEKKMREKEKFAGIGRMAAGIAHELRNPLSGIGGSIQLLDTNKNMNAGENKKLMDMALREVSRLNRIIGEFLDYAGDENSCLNALGTQPVNLNVVLEELLDNVRVQAKWEHITHHFTLKAHSFVQGNTDKFKQIFLNLVKNACEAMESHSSGKLEIESFDDNKHLVVRIKDTGVGISEEDKPYIYEPFYSKKEKGTGLGLSIARKLISFYKGELSYENRETGGTLCEVRFPVQPNLFPGEMKKSA